MHPELSYLLRRHSELRDELEVVEGRIRALDTATLPQDAPPLRLVESERAPKTTSPWAHKTGTSSCGLSSLQIAILRGFLAWEVNGIYATMGDVRVSIGCCRQTMSSHVKALTEMGYLEHFIGRSYSVTKAGVALINRLDDEEEARQCAG